MSELLFTIDNIYFIIMENTINSRLKEVRKHLGLNQKEMAEMLTVKQSYYSEVENGKRNVTGKLVEILNKEKSISSDWMYTGKGDKYTGVSTGISEDNVENDTLMLATKIDSKDVYELLLKKASKKKDKSEYWLLKVIRDIEQERPDIYSAMKMSIYFTSKVEILYDISENYFLNKAKKGEVLPIIPDYETFKIEMIKQKEVLLQYQDILKPFVAAAKRFIKAFEKFDVDKSISYYQDEDK